MRQIRRFAQTHSLALYIAACAAVFCWLLHEVSRGSFLPDSLGTAALTTWRPEWLTPIVVSITNLASPLAMLLVALTFVLLWRSPRPGIALTLSVAGASFLNVLLKALVMRPRPLGVALIAETGYSFPSGHAMVSCAFFRHGDLAGEVPRPRPARPPRTQRAADGRNRGGRALPHLPGCALRLRRPCRLVRLARLACLLHTARRPCHT